MDLIHQFLSSFIYFYCVGKVKMSTFPAFSKYNVGQCRSNEQFLRVGKMGIGIF